MCGRGEASRVSSVRNLRLLCELVSGSNSWYVGQMERTEIGGNDHPEQTPEIQAFTHHQPMLPSRAFNPKYPTGLGSNFSQNLRSFFCEKLNIQFSEESRRNSIRLSCRLGGSLRLHLSTTPTTYLLQRRRTLNCESSINTHGKS